MERATFGAGCFWGVEELFANTTGVQNTCVGYAGGHLIAPSYQDVCCGDSGHAEVVDLYFDPERVSYAQLLDVFFANHNPTTVNQQGPDIGSQYRSVIFYHTDQQRMLANQAIENLMEMGKWRDPVVTKVESLTHFYKAEEYHQRYLKKKGRGSCQF